MVLRLQTMFKSLTPLKTLMTPRALPSPRLTVATTGAQVGQLGILPTILLRATGLQETTPIVRAKMMATPKVKTATGDMATEEADTTAPKAPNLPLWIALAIPLRLVTDT